MSDKIFFIATNGQQLQQDDVNLLGETAGLAQDHVFAELLRMTPYDGSTVSKGILPPTASALIAPNGASGNVVVNAFRAFVGSRVAEATEALDNRQDIRSALSVAEAATNDQTTVTIAANASGNPRWDLIYAAVAVDANSPTVSRKIKDTSTKVVSSASVVLTKNQTMTISILAGTPGASPALPSIPADAGSTYYVALGYVRVPNGFGAASTVLNRNILISSKTLTLSATAAGVGICRPADSISVIGGAGLSGAGTSAHNGVMTWNGTTNTRPAAFMPATMTGSESLLIGLDLSNASSANWSHQNDAIIDVSRDWRFRLFKWVAAVGSNGSSAATFPWYDGTTAYTMMASDAIPHSSVGNTTGVIVYGMGHSFNTSGTSTACKLVAGGAAANNVPDTGLNVPTNCMSTGTDIVLYVHSSTGALHVSITGVPLCSVFIWLDATGQYSNR